MIAPGDDGWADCSTNTTMFTDCADIYQGSNPQPIVGFGGTSESCPLTAGVAALVIEAYQRAHGGADPSPAAVKRIIMSSADDISAPGDEQGAGLVDAQRAVQTALAYKAASTATGGLVYSPNSIALTGQPGAAESVPVTVTNTRSSAQRVTPSVRSLSAPTAVTGGRGTLDIKRSATATYQDGSCAPYAHTTFTVPAHQDRLLSQIVWDTNANNSTTVVQEDLFNPAGEMAAQSSPQGEGAGFGQVEVSKPAAGTWTLVVFSSRLVATEVVYTGKVSYAESTQTFQPTALTGQLIAAGGTATFHVPVITPPKAGDTSESVTFASTAGPSRPLGTVPVTLRALVPVTPSRPGKFNGTLTGGNARMGLYGQELSYQFDVPLGVHDLEGHVIVNQPGYTVEGFLVDPNENPVDVQDNVNFGLGDGHDLQLTWLNPMPGRWNLDLATFGGSTSGRISTTIEAQVAFSHVASRAATVAPVGLPAGQVLAPGGTTATVTVTNTGIAPEAYFIDPRLNRTTTYLVPSDVGTQGSLPDTNSVPEFIVPPFTSELDMVAVTGLQSGKPVPIDFDTSPGFGYPEVMSSTGDNAAAAVTGNPVVDSVWSCTPSEIGPFNRDPGGVAPASDFTCGASVITRAFDPSVNSTTGNFWSASLDGTPASLLLVPPGGRLPITVTFTPTAPAGTRVSGTLNVESVNLGTLSSDQIAGLPYSYTVDGGTAEPTAGARGTNSQLYEASTTHPPAAACRS